MQKLSFAEIKKLRVTPDADGVRRAFSKTLWDDPQVGALLREVGLDPDDPRNILPTAEDHAARFLAASERLGERVEAFNRAMTARHGYCRAVPLLVIDRPIWDGEHGAFLYALLELLPFDDWNVLMLAGDVRTKDVCGLAGHPGSIPAVTEVVTKRVAEWYRRHDAALEAFGVTATRREGRGITRAQYEVERYAIRQDIVDHIAWMKPRIVSELLRLQG
jgi:hypothetical protein